MQTGVCKLIRRAGGFLAVLAFLCLGPAEVGAQASEPDPVSAETFQSWAEFGRTTEEALEEGSIETATQAQYLRDLTMWRNRFDAAAARWEGPVDSLLKQLDALGEVPEGGESAELAARRNEIEAELRIAVTRLRRSEEASAHATSLIGRLEKHERSSWRSTLLTPIPSPLLPKTIGAMMRDIRVSAEKSPNRADTGSSDAAPSANRFLALLALFGGACLIFWGAALARIAITRAGFVDDEDAPEKVLFLPLALAEFALAMAGLVVFVVGVSVLLPEGPQSSEVLEILWRVGLLVVVVRWFAPRAIAEQQTRSMLGLDPIGRRQIIANLSFLSLPFGAGVFLSDAEDVLNISPETASVLGFALLVMMSFSLFAIGRVLTGLPLPSHENEAQETDLDDSEQSESMFSVRLGRGIGHVVVLLSLTGPVLAAFGYLELARYFIWEPTLTVWLLALIVFLQGVSDQLFELWSNPGDAGSNSLAAAISRLVIAISCLPVFAWIWGIRSASWYEFWYGISRGVNIGELHVSPGILAAFVATLILGVLATKLVQGTLRYSLLPRTDMRRGSRSALVAGVGYLGYSLSALAAFAAAGMDPRGLAVVAGALSVGIGFGLQGLVSNFLSGIVLLVERPFTVGDWIEMDESMGIVTRVSTRSTTIETFDKTEVIIPNAQLVGNKVTNWTLANNAGRLILPIGVGYDSDSEKVEEILREVAAEHPLVVAHPPPLIVFRDFGDSALEFEVRVILRDINFGLSARTQLNHRILARLREEGIKIPYPQRDVTLTNIGQLKDLSSESSSTKSNTSATEKPEASD